MKNADIIISNGTVITMDGARQVIERGAVVIEGKTIIAVGDEFFIRRQYTEEKLVDATGMCEAFLDAAHIPFVHDGLLGSAQYAEIPPYEVTITDQGISTDNVMATIPVQGDTDSMTNVAFTYESLSPIAVYTARNHSGSEASTQRTVLMLSVRPLTETRCSVYFSLAWHGESDKQRLAEIIQFDVDVLMQDKPIVESQIPKRLPLGRSEIHLESDALTSAYRRYLKELGVAYGTQ